MKKTKKKVTFAFMRDVCIIPNIEDIYEENLSQTLWWDTDEFIEMKKNAQHEFRQYLLFNKDAKKKKNANSLWYDLDFDEIYNIVSQHKINKKIELKSSN